MLEPLQGEWASVQAVGQWVSGPQGGEGVWTCGAEFELLPVPEIPRASLTSAFPILAHLDPFVTQRLPGTPPTNPFPLTPVGVGHKILATRGVLGDTGITGPPQIRKSRSEMRPGVNGLAVRPGVLVPGESFSFVSCKLMGNSRKSHSDFQRLLLNIPSIYFSIYNYMY